MRQNKNYILELFIAKARPSAINTQKIEIRDRTTNQIIENINKTVGILNTTKQRPLQENGMAAISKRCSHRPWYYLHLFCVFVCHKNADLADICQPKRRASSLRNLLTLILHSNARWQPILHLLQHTKTQIYRYLLILDRWSLWKYIFL